MTGDSNEYSLGGFKGSHIFRKPGTFKGELFVYNDVGCVDTFSVPAINVFAIPELSISYSVNPNKSSEYHFHHNSSQALSIYWDFGDGTQSTGQDPIHEFIKNDNYRVVLSGVSSVGCIGTDSQWIIMAPSLNFWIPNAFTPDNYGSEENNVFRPKGGDMISFILKVSDRKGQMLFQGQENEGWDGKIKGVLAETGVYYYYVIITDEKGVRHERRGDLSLLR